MGREMETVLKQHCSSARYIRIDLGIYEYHPPISTSSNIRLSTLYMNAVSETHDDSAVDDKMKMSPETELSPQASAEPKIGHLHDVC